eukprot:2265503-Rhodomonas_salina.1
MSRDLQPSHPLPNVPKRSRLDANQNSSSGAVTENTNANTNTDAPVQQQQQQQQQPAPYAAAPLHTKRINIRPPEANIPITMAKTPLMQKTLLACLCFDFATQISPGADVDMNAVSDLANQTLADVMDDHEKNPKTSEALPWLLHHLHTSWAERHPIQLDQGWHI